MAERLAKLTRVALGALWLSACSGDPRDNPAWTLGGEPGLLFVIKQYYERNALEEGGICASPLLEGVTHSRVSEEDGRLSVDLGYYYRDMARDGDDCDRFRLLRCGVMRECQGFAERSFVVGREGDALQVLEMSGERKGRVWQPKRPAAASPPETPSAASGRSDP
jgi:hypothetical protein